MQIGQILDKTTVVVIGPGVAELKDDEPLDILAVGREIPSAGVPLVIPKARVRVTTVAGAYVIARAETYEVDTTTHVYEILASSPRTRTERKRRVLSVDESQVVGNPAGTPIVVGDPVIRPGDLLRFIKALPPQSQSASLAGLVRAMEQKS
jgi:hypothetical protein